jgi:hypothetical protein
MVAILAVERTFREIIVVGCVIRGGLVFFVPGFGTPDSQFALGNTSVLHRLACFSTPSRRPGARGRLYQVSLTKDRGIVREGTQEFIPTP